MPLLIWHLQHLVLISGSDLAQSLQKVLPLHYLPIVEFVTIVYLASLLTQRVEGKVPKKKSSHKGEDIV